MPRVTRTTPRAASAGALAAALVLGGFVLSTCPTAVGASASPSASPSDRPAARSHLLDAGRLPALAGREWKTRSRDVAGDAPAVGACQKTPLGSLGALATVHRSYTTGDGARATQVVARFVDARSTWRAHQVLLAWREDCEERVTDAAVGPLEPVSVSTGTADGYRASYARSRATGLAMLRSGTYLTLVEVATGLDRYPATWDPARKAVRRIARSF